MEIAGDYNAHNFQCVLTGLEAVRARPGIYVGDTGAKGLHHLFKEIADNALDEAMAGHCTKIDVTNNADGSLTVEDNGRGISVEIHGNPGKTGVELVLTELHAGYKHNFGGYKVPGGLHGVGASCVNALSEWLECEIKQNGKIHRMRFERGVPTGPLSVTSDCPKGETGTKITWLPDPEVFANARDENGNLAFDPQRITARLRELAFLNPETTFTFHDAARSDAPDVFHFPHGVADYVAFLNEGKLVSHDVFSFAHSENDTHLDVALQYTEGGAENIVAFANTLFLKSGGTSVTGFKTGLTRAINRVAHQNGFLHENKNFAGSAVRHGLTAVVTVRMRNPSFEAATKDKLTSLEAESLVSRATYKYVSAFLAENPDTARRVIGKIESCR